MLKMPVMFLYDPVRFFFSLSLHHANIFIYRPYPLPPLFPTLSSSTFLSPLSLPRLHPYLPLALSLFTPHLPVSSPLYLSVSSSRFTAKSATLISERRCYPVCDTSENSSERISLASWVEAKCGRCDQSCGPVRRRAGQGVAYGWRTSHAVCPPSIVVCVVYLSENHCVHHELFFNETEQTGAGISALL